MGWLVDVDGLRRSKAATAGSCLLLKPLAVTSSPDLSITFPLTGTSCTAPLKMASTSSSPATTESRQELIGSAVAFLKDPTVGPWQSACLARDRERPS